MNRYQLSRLAEADLEDIGFLIIFLPQTLPLQVLRIWDASRGTPALR